MKLMFIASSLSLLMNQTELERVSKTWKARRDRLASVMCAAKAQSLVVKGRFNKSHDESKDLLPPADLTFAKETKWMLDLKKNWARRETNSQTFHWELKAFSPSFQVEVFDGNEYLVSSPRDKNSGDVYKPSPSQPDFWVKGKKLEGFFFKVTDFPLFLSLGVIVSKGKGVSPRNMLLSQDSKLETVGQTVVEGRDSLVLRTTDNPRWVDEYCVDPARESLVVRWSSRYRKTTHLYAKAEIHYRLDEVLGWVPTEWVISEHNWNDGKLLTSDRVHVDAFSSTEFKKEDFVIAPTAGMTVGRSEKGALALFKVAQDGTMEPFGKEETRSKRSLNVWLVVLTSCLLLALLWRVYFKRKTGRSRP